MKDFPSCFGENGVQVADTSTSATSRASPQNLVTCTYQYESRSFSGFATVTWIKYMMGQGLSIGIENANKECLCKAEINPWLFSKRKGFKKLMVDSIAVDIHWDLSSAKFGSSPEPLEGFFLSISLNHELCLLLGDLEKKAYTKIDPTTPIAPKVVFVARREHICGKRLYSSKAQFSNRGQLHDIRIEYDPRERYDKCLVIYVDRKEVLQVTHLKWKFRGNQTILVDGISVEVYWDVHSWLFGTVNDNAIFLFRSRGGPPGDKLTTPSLHNSQLQAFSLVLCVWKNE